MNTQTITLKTVGKAKIDMLLAKRDEINAIIEESKEILDQINGELYKRVASEPERKMTVGERKISIVKRPSFKDVPLEFAKKYKAIKKVIDGSVLSPLYAKGIAIPNVTVSEYVMVK